MFEIDYLNEEKIEEVNKDEIINLVFHTIKLNKQILIFNSSKASSEKIAFDTANFLDKKNFDLKSKEELENLSQKILNSLSVPTKQCKKLSDCIKFGVAFHHSGLTTKQRNLIEENFKKGILKIISSTPTLAAGLNLPAYKVIIRDYRRFSNFGYNDIPVLEYHQMSGRAGRFGFENVGHSVIYTKNKLEVDRVADKYIFGESEEITSKLAVEPILKFHLLSLISINVCNNKKEIEDFFLNTFHASQYRDITEIKILLDKIINSLESFGFIELDDDLYIATKLGRKVCELYLSPDTANFFLKNFEKVNTLFKDEKLVKFRIYSFIHLICFANELKPLFRVLKKEEEIYYKKLETIDENLLINFEPYEMDLNEFLKMIKSCNIFMDWICEENEEYLMSKYEITPGELNYKIENLDWLLYCYEEFSLLKKNFFLKNTISKLRKRFKFGIKEELLPFIILKGVGRVRARQIYKSGIKTLLDLKKVNIAKLEKIVGKNLAKNILEEIKKDSFDDKINTFLKPKEINVRREVLDEEVEELLEAYENFEKSLKGKNKKLDDFI